MWNDFKLSCRVLYSAARKGVTYNGCTAVPDFDFGADCCNTHDYYYQTKVISRAEADVALRKCIKAKGHPILAWVYWAGVRVVGWYFWRQHKSSKE